MSESYDENLIIQSEFAYELLKKRRSQLELLLKSKELEIVVAPAGSLHAVEKKKSSQILYYQRLSSTEKTGKYIKKADENLALALAQKEYDKKIIDCIKIEIKSIDKFLKSFSKYDCSKIYSRLSKIKQPLVTPVVESDDVFIAKWLQHIVTTNYHEDNRIFITKNNDCVRSKSEMLIANLLSSNNIPYKYENPLTNNGKIWAIPDFTALKVKTREELCWEHFGMMDDPAYAANALLKISKYESNGYFPGKNMIITFESSKMPINTDNIQNIIQAYFL